MANHGEWQFGIYFNGLVGQKPTLPMSYDALERAAEAAMSEEVWSYVAGGAGNEHGSHTDEAVESRDELRHGGHFDLQGHRRADETADHESRQNPTVRHDIGIYDRGQDSDRHPDDCVEVPGAGRVR